MIGRHENAFIQLEHRDVSTRHAILFRFMGFPAVFDLGGRNGLHVNEQPCSITSLYNDDTINVGPFSLNVSSPQSPESPQQTETPHPTVLPDKNYQKRTNFCLRVQEGAVMPDRKFPIVCQTFRDPGVFHL